MVDAVVRGPYPQVLNTNEGKQQSRSVVSVRKATAKSRAGAEELLVGDVAVSNWPMNSKNTITSIKRLMGRSYSDDQVQRARNSSTYDIVLPSHGTKDGVAVIMGGKEYSP